MARTLFVSKKSFEKKHLVHSIPEQASRIHAITKAVKGATLKNVEFYDRFESASMKSIGNTHDKKYIDSLFHPLNVTAVRNYLETLRLDVSGPHSPVQKIFRNKRWEENRDKIIDEAIFDTPITNDTADAACEGAGAILDAVDQVILGNARNAFCAVRPPGHHAEYDFPMGFCFLNNVGIAANHLLQNHGMKKVCVIDWDVHHGNGTQHLFYDSSKVLVCNMHQHPENFYPFFSGYEDEVGVGEGEGYNINIPLRAGSGEVEYDGALSKILKAVEAYQPEFILLSAGFDAHFLDPLGSMNLNETSFAHFTKKIVKSAEGINGGKIVSVLEGGYHLDALARCVVAHLEALSS